MRRFAHCKEVHPFADIPIATSALLRRSAVQKLPRSTGCQPVFCISNQAGSLYCGLSGEPNFYATNPTFRHSRKKVQPTLRRAVRSQAFAGIPGGRHMECAYCFGRNPPISIKKRANPSIDPFPIDCICSKSKRLLALDAWRRLDQQAFASQTTLEFHLWLVGLGWLLILLFFFFSFSQNLFFGPIHSLAR